MKQPEKRLDAIETMLNDTDRDGVPDYLDAENNTPTGVAVDSKGRFYDKNNNGTPDELEPKQKIFDNEVIVNNNEENATIQLLLKKGVFNIFYEVNSVTPDAGSTNNAYQILNFLKNNPERKIKLIGYADVSGNEKANIKLSEQRAKKLRELYIKSGIAAERIKIEGQGVDSIQPKSNLGLRFARRVAVELIE